jgi:hypothetical protein
VQATAGPLNPSAARTAARPAPICPQQAKPPLAQVVVAPSDPLSARTAAHSTPIGLQQAKTLSALGAVGLLNPLSAEALAHLALIGRQQVKAPPVQAVAAPSDSLLARAAARSAPVGQQQEETVASSTSVPPSMHQSQTARQQSGFHRGRCQDRGPWPCGRRQSTRCNPEHRRTKSSRPRGWSGGPENAGAWLCRSGPRPCIWRRARGRHLASPIARPSR